MLGLPGRDLVAARCVGRSLASRAAAHREHRTRGDLEQACGHAAQEPASETGAPVRADDDEAGPPALRETGDRLGGRALYQAPPGANTSAHGFRDERIETTLRSPPSLRLELDPARRRFSLREG